MSENMKEPWRVVFETEIENADGELVTEILGEQMQDDSPIAHRIVACVNACAGIPTEELGEGNTPC